MTRPLALYVHVPFCISVCPYCDFVVYGGSAARGPANRIAATVDALVTEIRLRAPNRPTAPLRSVYLGGGTPSLLTPDQVTRLLTAAAESFGMATDAEVTLECNPGSADRGDLAGFHAAGVNRLSIGAQSFDATELRRLGRRHSAPDIATTVGLARDGGYQNVSIDLLYDVPRQSVESWRTTLNAAIALEPEHISAYALTLDNPDLEGLTGPTGDHLPLRTGARRWRDSAADEQDDALAADCYEVADNLLTAAGYGWYEISNWAKRGRESRHNLAYWTGDAWEAVGPGAHAFDGALTRRWNAARLEGYLTALAAGELPPGDSEVTDPPTSAAEAAILRLRTAAGLTLSQAGDAGFRSALAWGRAHELVASGENGRMRLTLKGRLLSNELFARLLPSSSASLVA